MKNQTWSNMDTEELLATLLASQPKQFLSHPVRRHRIDMSESQYARVVRCVKNAEALVQALDGCLTWLTQCDDYAHDSAYFKQGEKALAEWEASEASHLNNSESNTVQQ